MLPTTSEVEIICPTSDATSLTKTLPRLVKHWSISEIVLIIFCIRLLGIEKTPFSVSMLVPNQVRFLVGVHNDFSALGTKPLLIKSFLTCNAIELHNSWSSCTPSPSSKYIITCFPSPLHFLISGLVNFVNI